MKQSSLQAILHLLELLKCLKMLELLSVSRFSRTLVDKCWLISPTYAELHSAQINLYTTLERNDLGTDRRYVDDTFCLFNNKHEALVFFEFLNSQHDSIKFTMEKENNNSLAFLDVLINNKDPTNLITSSPGQTLSTFHYTTLDMHVE